MSIKYKHEFKKIQGKHPYGENSTYFPDNFACSCGDFVIDIYRDSNDLKIQQIEHILLAEGIGKLCNRI
jgi:hypothetical protein